MIGSGTNRLKVTIGKKVFVRFGDGITKDLQVVNDSSISPWRGMVSHKSPVGRALLGAKVNEEKKYKVDGKAFSFKVLEIR